MIIHDFNKSIFLRHYIQLLSKYFDINAHLLLTTVVDQHDKDAVYPECFNNFEKIVKPNKGRIASIIHSFKILPTLSKADLIITHGFSLQYYHLLKPSLLKKTVWVIWGYDLYDYRNTNRTIYQKLAFFLKKNLVRKIPYVIARPTDFKLLQEHYQSNAQLFIVEPLYGVGSKPIPHIRESESETIHITLGNSATPTNLHFDALEHLSKFKDEDIRIYLPLSYGDMEYAKSVREKAESLFGEKVVVLDKFMSPEDYRVFLSKMDIGIFNNNRQQALGNISNLFKSGAKVYLNSESPLWDVVCGDWDMQAYSVQSIDSMTYQEFIHVDDLVQQENTRKTCERGNVENAVNGWKKVFALAEKK